jgi:hypothetical protein
MLVTDQVEHEPLGMYPARHAIINRRRAHNSDELTA